MYRERRAGDKAKMGAHWVAGGGGPSSPLERWPGDSSVPPAPSCFSRSDKSCPAAASGRS